MAKFNHSLFFAAFTSVSVLNGGAGADVLDRLERAVGLIEEMAVSICDDYQSSGGSFDLSAEVEAGTELTGLFKKLADVYADGDLSISNSQYSGVVREELASEIKSNRECRERIFNSLLPVATADLTAPVPEELSSSPVESATGVGPGNRSISTAYFAGIAAPDIEQNAFLNSSDEIHFFSFVAPASAACSFVTESEARDTRMALYAPSKEQVFITNRNRQSRKLGAGNYSFSIQADSPGYYSFEIFCEPLN